jgi:acetylornithine deacetylase/succinyl-diaminopimelate desuccinylase-like protein
LQDNLEDYDFGIMITTDEEIGGFDGAQRLAEAGYNAKVIVLPDGGNNWNMERFAKGIWFVTIDSHGHSAHGSRPWEGDNAIEKLMTALAEIRALLPPEQHAEGNTLNIGTIQGGDVINLIPPNASASLDFRFINQNEKSRVQAAVKKILKQHGLTYTTEVDAKPVHNKTEDPLVQAYVKISEQVTGKPVEWIVSMAGNDGRFFVENGTALAVGYPAGGNHHGHGEWLAEDSLEKMEQLFTKYIQEVTKKPSKTTKPVA